MSDVNDALDLVQQIDAKRAGRRSLLLKAGMVGAAAVGAGLLGKTGGGSIAQAAERALYKPTVGKGFVVNDYDILNFALNLEYLEASFYQLAALGNRLNGSDYPGVGTQGTVTGGQQISFTDPVVNRLADELADEELTHVNLLRTALGARAVAMPDINLDAFTPAAAAAQIPGTFDAYADDGSFLIGAFTFEDVGVTAYNGAAPFISNSKYLGTAASILAVEAYHAGAVRMRLFDMYETLQDAANAISALRDAASTAIDASNPNTDVPLTVTAGAYAMFAADNSDALANTRTFQQVLNIVYLNAAATIKAGGFFPSGVNGRIN